MMPSDRNPLRESSVGKGDKPRNCHNETFRNNYDSINWKKGDKNEEKESSDKERSEAS